jgi:hypothetical protein
MTLNQIIATIKSQVDLHKQINKFAVGTEFDMAAETVEYYPLFWLIPNGFIPNLPDSGGANKNIDYQFTALLVDKTLESKANSIEVLSDMATVIIDISTMLYRQSINNDFQFIFSGQTQPFYDAKSDVIGGYAFDFTIRVPNQSSFCDIPT